MSRANEEVVQTFPRRYAPNTPAKPFQPYLITFSQNS
jgi:hypothetical protein